MTEQNLDDLLAEIRACQICKDSPSGPALPHDPRPVIRVTKSAAIAIVGQAPGTRVHASGLPFDDPSGDRLRTWMGVDRPEFYDESKISIIPMGFCFPGINDKGGDLPPRSECRKNWHDRLFPLLPKIGLMLVIGQYAQSYHIPDLRKKTLTETVLDWQNILSKTNGDEHRPSTFVLPHPSWRNSGWLKKNPWFEADLLPTLRQRIRSAIDGVSNCNS